MDSSRKTSGSTSTPINIVDLRPGMENVSVRVRVINVTPPKTIETKRGTRTISNAIVGDATGRVEAVLWGERATALHENDVVDIKGAWVTEYRGRVQLNIGKSTIVEKAPSDSVPEEIPENEPRATGAQRPFRPQRRGFQKRGKRGGTYGE